MKRLFWVIAAGAFAFLVFSILKRVDPKVMSTRFVATLADGETKLWVRVPYGGYSLSYDLAPNLSAVSGKDALHLPEVSCHTVIRQHGTVIIDTWEKQFTWADRDAKGEPLEVACQVHDPQKRPIYLTVKAAW